MYSPDLGMSACLTYEAGSQTFYNQIYVARFSINYIVFPENWRTWCLEYVDVMVILYLYTARLNVNDCKFAKFTAIRLA